MMNSNPETSTERPMVCPQCESNAGLWQGVEVTGTSWRSYGDSGDAYERSDFYVEGVYPDGTVGCSECNWEGREGALIPEPVKDREGEPIPDPIPGQMTIELGGRL